MNIKKAWRFIGGGFDPISLDPNLFESIGVAEDLTIPTYDANLNTTHPDIIYRPLGWNGYKYWMIHTPYPLEVRENPSIVASNDGEAWVEPPGIVNPIEPGAVSPYNSDTDLVDRIDSEGVLYAFWRWSDYVTTQIFYKTSVDGITWINKTLVLSLPDAAASPSILYHNGKWKVWYVDVRGAGTTLYGVRYREATTLAGLQAAPEQTITLAEPLGYHKWHLKVRYDNTLRQYVMVINYTIAQVGVPNNGGVLSVATSLDGIIWTARTALLPMNVTAYRSTFFETPYATENGAKYEFFYTRQWRIKRSLLWLKSATRPAQVFDSVAGIDSYYGLRIRLSNWYGLPVARVQRSTDSAIRDIFDVSGVLKLADGTLLDTWKGVATLEVKRIYNQKGNGDYLPYVTGPQLEKRSNIWDNEVWTMVFDGVNDATDSFTGTHSVKGYTLPISMQAGRFVTNRASASYFGLNSSTLTLLNGTNIGVLHNDIPQILSGFFGAGGTAKIRKDGVDLITGSTTVPGSAETIGLGAQASGGASYTNYFAGAIPEIIVWGSVPSAPDLAVVENQFLSDYVHAQVVKLYDSYTDTNGVLVTAHVADTRPGSNVYTANDALWQIQSNKLTRISAGSASPIPMCHIDAGITDGITEGILNPAGTGGSGLIFKYVDDNNLCYVRLFNNVTLGVIRYVGGVLQTPALATISAPGKPFTLKVEQIGTTIRIYVNGTLQLTYTESNFGASTRRGWACSTSEPTSTFEDLRVTKW